MEEEIVEKAGRDPKDFALHSLRIGGSSTLAAGGEVSERVVQRAGKVGFVQAIHGKQCGGFAARVSYSGRYGKRSGEVAGGEYGLG